MEARDLSVRSEAAILIGLDLGNDPVEADPLAELERLAGTAGATVVHKFYQRRARPDPATYVGRGKLDAIAAIAREKDADVLVFDDDLKPAQVRNIEVATERKAIDRSELILDIFATHARSRQAKLQVELAQLEYTYPRLRRMWTHLSRMEGGIGMRGPGEKQIETDRRIVQKRITRLRDSLRRIESQKGTQLKGRGSPTVALVGYTNSGKSTLMNRLTNARVLVQDKLFATLDTRTRAWPIGDGHTALLSDTVGFIRKLPHHLVASFHATLEEVIRADLLLHVVDACHPDGLQQVETVRRVLNDLGCRATPRVLVLNKMDAVKDEAHLHLLRSVLGDGVEISARTGSGLGGLVAAVKTALAHLRAKVDLAVPVSEGKLIASLLATTEVLEQRYTETHVHLRVRLPRKELGRLRRYRRGQGSGGHPDPTKANEAV
jgi:GTP-binding protein HflX